MAKSKEPVVLNVINKLRKPLNSTRTFSTKICSQTTKNSRTILWNKIVIIFLEFEVFTAMTMKNAVFWDVTPRDTCKKRSSGGSSRLHHHGGKNQRARNNVSPNYQPKHSAKKP
jgi:hypothetical protein